jgi:Kef-type K+ transport system membrane component KefB
MVSSELKKLGKGIIYITFFEAQVTFLIITLGFIIALPFITHLPKATLFATFIPLSLLLGCLGSPTDPSVALAVTHQYKAKGEVASTMLNVAGLDDILGIINFSIAVVIAKALITHEVFSLYNAFIVPIFIIAGSVILGSVLGLIFNFIASKLTRQTEGVLFVLILSSLTLCWGVATLIHTEEILSIMVMGIVVTNFNPMRDRIFKMLERYSEELVFLIFFTLSGMHLDFSIISATFILLAFFVVYRIMGKFAGTFIGAEIAHSSSSVKKHTATGLIPFGGIVIGLALIMHQDCAFNKISGFLVSTIVGATIINEFIGPIFVKKALKDAGEIS